MTKTIIRLNQVDESKKADIMSLLGEKYLGIKLNKDQACGQLYYAAFRELKKSCQSQLTLNSEYIWNKTIENYDFYLNLKDPSIYSWIMPKDFEPTPYLITRTSLKVSFSMRVLQFYEISYYKKQYKIIKINS